MPKPRKSIFIKMQRGGIVLRLSLPVIPALIPAYHASSVMRLTPPLFAHYRKLSRYWFNFLNRNRCLAQLSWPFKVFALWE